MDDEQNYRGEVRLEARIPVFVELPEHADQLMPQGHRKTNIID